MTLSDSQIKQNIQSGNIKVTGYMEEFLNPASLDVRLGSQVRTYKPNTDEGVDYLDPFEPLLTEIKEIPSNGLILTPGKVYLAETYETIKLPRNIGCYVLAKSSLGRLGLDIIIGPAGWIDPGFEGNVVLELRCTQPILIKRYMRIAQFKFERIDGTINESYEEKESSKYQYQKNIQPSLYYRNYSLEIGKLQNTNGTVK